jgi:predicted transcriptional regulator
METEMPKKRPRASQYELAVLEVLWQRGAATIRQITEQVYGEVSTTTYATVQKLIERLEKKKCVTRTRKPSAHVFRAKVDRSELLGQGLEDLAEKLCDGSLTPILIHLVEHTKLKKRDLEILRRLIADTK